jgi:hypothetical protein
MRELVDTASVSEVSSTSVSQACALLPPYLLADPDGMSSGFHRYPDRIEIAEALIHPRWVGSEATTVDDLAPFVDSAVMAPDVSKVDSHRCPDPGASEWTS